MGLKNFLIQEELKTSHAERYLTYVDRYHDQVFHDVKTKLESQWEKTVKAVLKSHPIRPEVKQETLLQNPKATTEVSLSHAPEKIVTSRSPTPLEVSPSVKIPLIYSKEERDMITKKILAAAKSAMEDTVSSWGEIFNYEKRGRVTPWFKITTDHEEVRLQLAISADDQESYKTLYAVRIEYGRKGSKIKDFDRIYLVNRINS